MERLTVGISGASGTPLACRFVQQLKEHTDLEIHLIATESACLTASYEAPQAFAAMLDAVNCVHDNEAMGAQVASGTFRTRGMVVIPCSMKTVAGIATGYSDNLLLRAADVTIKEQRPLVLATRETPVSPLHLKNMTTLAALPHVTLMPPMMTYYHHPKTIEDMEDQIIGKIFERFGLDYPPFSRWGE